MAQPDDIIQLYRENFGQDPAYVVRAPGRVNLIGEHTDYNDGYVLPMAIERAVYVALTPTPQTTRLNVYLQDFDRLVSFDITKPISYEEQSPLEYVKGVTQALLNKEKDLTAWDGVIQGDIPIGAGLSSSAALEMAILYAYKAIDNFRLVKKDRARLGQWVENEWMDVQSGIMDQMVVVYGAKGKAILIDCRSLKTTEVALPDDTAVVILDTGTRRTLDGSAYNERRKQCEAAAAFYEVEALRDLSLEDFETKADDLDDLPRKRARHVITENARVLAAKDAAKKGDAVAFGQLMNESHASLRDDFEVSSEALNTMVEIAQAHDACYGARMTGGGFAGCAVALVQAQAAADFAEQTAEAYAQQTDHTPEVYITQPTEGAETLIKNV